MAPSGSSVRILKSINALNRATEFDYHFSKKQSCYIYNTGYLTLNVSK